MTHLTHVMHLVHDRPCGVTLAAAGLLAGAGFVLPDPANLAAFLGALGLGLGIGVAAFIERVGRARAQAYKEWEAVHRDSSLSKLEEAGRQLEQKSEQVDEHGRMIIALQADLDVERGMNEKLRDDLQGFAIRVLQEKGYIAVPADPHTPAPPPAPAPAPKEEDPPR